MEPDRWQRMWALFDQASERPVEERSAFLRLACPDDPELRTRVQELLADEPPPSGFLKSSPGIGPLRPPGPDPLVGQSIGPYRITGVIGEGGMGVVYDAEQQAPARRRVALKLIRQGLESRELLARFDSERQALALMTHPHIAKVLDLGASDDGRPFFVMERVEGRPITEHCDEARLSLGERLELFLPVCAAVQHAHQKGILHRDLKPSNIVVAQDNGRPRPMIIDFGVAKLVDPGFAHATAHTRIGTLLGTPEYMSPEQWEMGDDVDTRSDVYSLGVILYEILTGTLPLKLRGKPFSEAWRIQLEQDTETPSSRVSTLGERSRALASHRGLDPEAFRRQLAGDLDWIVMKALEKDRERRYGSASELGSDIERHLHDQPVSAGPPSRLYRARKFVRRHRVGVAAATAFVIALLGGFVGTTWMAIERAKARDEARREAAVAQAINDFLTQMLAAPAALDGRSERAGIETRVVDVLDRAASELDAAFTEQPLAEAAVRYTLAETYGSLGQGKVAETHHRRALEIRQSLLGSDHPRTLESAESLASSLHALGRIAEAAPYWRSVFEARSRDLGDDHPDTLQAMANLNQVLRGLDRSAETALLAERAFEIYSRELEDPVLEQPYPLNPLARIVPETERAIPFFEKLLEHRRELLGNDHPDTIDAIWFMAMMFEEANDFAARQRLFRELEPTFRRRLEESRRRYGNHAATTLQGTMRLAEAVGLESAEAGILLRELYTTLQRVRGESSFFTRSTGQWLGDNLVVRGELAEAEVVYRQLLSVPDGGQYRGFQVSMRLRLGHVLTKMDRFQEAEMELLDGYSKEKEDSKASRTQLALALLIQLYDAWGKLELADEYRLAMATLESSGATFPVDRLGTILHLSIDETALSSGASERSSSR